MKNNLLGTLHPKCQSIIAYLSSGTQKNNNNEVDMHIYLCSISFESLYNIMKIAIFLKQMQA